MFSSFLLALREGLEAALIIGIVLGTLRKISQWDQRAAVWRGSGAAALVSLLAAVVLQLIGAEFEGRGEQLFEGTAMLLAAALLTWMIFWMQRQAGSTGRALEAGVEKAAVQGGAWALFLLAFLAVVREGLELALFLTAATFTTGAVQAVSGTVVGLAAAALLGYLLFATTRRLSLKQFFRITNVLLILFAAGLFARSVHEFNEAGLVPAVIEHIWDLTPLLSDTSALGQLVGALFGYSASPSLTEVGAYGGYFLVLLWLFQKAAHPVKAASLRRA
jgi:high-affinity iron transporter